MVIIAPVDRTSLATHVLNQARSLAKAFNDEIHVIHVLSRSEFIEMEQTSIEKTRSAIPVQKIRNLAAEIAHNQTKDLDVPYETVGLVGKPASTIVEYAEEQDTRYIVIASEKRSPAGKVVFGSTAQSIILNTECPIVIAGKSSQPV